MLEKLREKGLLASFLQNHEEIIELGKMVGEPIPNLVQTEQQNRDQEQEEVPHHQSDDASDAGILEREGVSIEMENDDTIVFMFNPAPGGLLNWLHNACRFCPTFNF